MTENILTPEQTQQQAQLALEQITHPILAGKRKGLWTAFRDFKEHGIFDIVGKQVDVENGKITELGFKQLATALQIYRDKRFETFRYVFVSPNGEINGQYTVSTNMPARTSVGNKQLKTFEKVVSYAEKTNSKIVIVHNHPSGDVTPSGDDILTTRTLLSQFTPRGGTSRIIGHIILDHNDFSLGKVYGDEIKWTTENINHYSKDPLMKNNLPEFSKKQIYSFDDVQEIARQINQEDKWNTKDFTPVIFTNASSFVTVVKQYPNSFFLKKSTEEIKKNFQDLAELTGSIRSIPIITEENYFNIELQEAIKNHYKNGAFLDFCITDGLIFQTAISFEMLKKNEIFQNMTQEEFDSRVKTQSTFKEEINPELFGQPDFRLEDDKLVAANENVNEYKNDKSINYIYSKEFIEKFGDWEKANRLEKLKESDDVNLNNALKNANINVQDFNILKEQKLFRVLKNLVIANYASLRDENSQLLISLPDKNLNANLSVGNIKHILSHQIAVTGQIEAALSINEIAKKTIYISSDIRDGKNTNPDIKTYDYFMCGATLNGALYTIKSVVGYNSQGEARYYDQRATEIEKGLYITNQSLITNKGKNNIQPIKNYDKRLLEICQVPQLPYMKFNPQIKKWLPTQKAIELVKSGNLHIEKIGQEYQMKENIQKKAQPTQEQNMENKDFFNKNKVSSAPEITDTLAKLFTNTLKEYEFNPHYDEEKRTYIWEDLQNSENNEYYSSGDLLVEKIVDELHEIATNKLLDTELEESTKERFTKIAEYTTSYNEDVKKAIIENQKIQELKELNYELLNGARGYNLENFKKRFDDSLEKLKTIHDKNPNLKEPLIHGETILDIQEYFKTYNGDSNIERIEMIQKIVNFEKENESIENIIGNGSLSTSFYEDSIKKNNERIQQDKNAGFADVHYNRWVDFNNDTQTIVDLFKNTRRELGIQPENAIIYPQEEIDKQEKLYEQAKEKTILYLKADELYENERNELENFVNNKEYDVFLHDIPENTTAKLNSVLYERNNSVNESQNNKVECAIFDITGKDENNKEYTYKQLFEITRDKNNHIESGITAYSTKNIDSSINENQYAVNYACNTVLILNPKILYNSYKAEKINKNYMTDFKPLIESGFSIHDANNKDLTSELLFENPLKKNIQRTPSQIAQNWAIDKIRAAGIEVISDKNEFDKILESEKLLQKMSVDLSEIEALSKQLKDEKEKNAKKQKEENKNKNKIWKDFTKFATQIKQYLPSNKQGSFESLKKMEGINIESSSEYKLSKINNTLYIINKQEDIKVSLNEEHIEYFSELNFTPKIEITKQNLTDYLQEQITIELQKQNKTLNEYSNSINNNYNNDPLITSMKEISNVLKTGEENTVFNKTLKEVDFRFGNKNEGLAHIIKRRIEERMNRTENPLSFADAQKEVAMILTLVRETVINSEATINQRGNWDVELNGIKAVIAQDIDGRYVLTGFDNKQKKEEATATINAGIAKYSYAPEFLDMYAQVGAVYSSLTNIQQYLNKSSTQSMTLSDGTTYGFTHEGKIYLNPDVVNSSTPIHEYTHLWDAYIQNTNAELWQKGKEAFKETSLWNEVISDPNYADIADNDDLVLSECHARITGKVAEKVLEKIALENGEIAKDKVIDWDKETWQYIAENYSVDITKFASVAEFIQTPMKDLMEGKNISMGQNLTEQKIIIDEIINQVNQSQNKEYTMENEKIEIIKTTYDSFMEDMDEEDSQRISEIFKNDIQAKPLHILYDNNELNNPEYIIAYNEETQKYSVHQKSGTELGSSRYDISTLENAQEIAIDRVRQDSTPLGREIVDYELKDVTQYKKQTITIIEPDPKDISDDSELSQFITRPDDVNLGFYKAGFETFMSNNFDNQKVASYTELKEEDFMIETYYKTLDEDSKESNNLYIDITAKNEEDLNKIVEYVQDTLEEYELETLEESQEIEHQSVDKPFLEEAQDLISDFTFNEFMSTPTFDDLEHIGIAYTTSESEELEINVEVDLKRWQINTYVAPSGTENYATIKNLVESSFFITEEEMLEALNNLNFDELVSPIYDKEQLQKTIGFKPQSTEEKMYFADVQNAISDNDLDVIITGIKEYNSPDKVNENDTNVLVEYVSLGENIREDDFFEMLHNIDFITDDIDYNPITPSKSGTIAQYLEELNSYNKQDIKNDINIDLWYDNKIEDVKSIDINFYDLDAEYRGNLYDKEYKAIGDFSTQDSLIIQKSFPHLKFDTEFAYAIEPNYWIENIKHNSFKVANQVLYPKTNGIADDDIQYKNSDAEKLTTINNAIKELKTQSEEKKFTATELKQLEILIKGKDAFEHGIDSLVFIRPNAEQLASGFENGWKFDEVIKGYIESTDGINNSLTLERIDNMEVFDDYDDIRKMAEIDGVKLLTPHFDYDIKKVANEFSEGEESRLFLDTPENRELLKDYLITPELKAKQVAQNWAIDKIRAAGIEVISDKNEFDKILETNEILQKMNLSLSEDEIANFFKFKTDEVTKFHNAIDNYDSTKNNQSMLHIIGRITPVMKAIGIPDEPIEIENKTIAKAIRQVPRFKGDKAHKLSLDDIKAVPDCLADPIMVFNSATRKDSFVFFTERKDYRNQSIVIPVSVNKQKGRLVINEVTSMYGKDDEFALRNIKDNNLLYVDTKRYFEYVDWLKNKKNHRVDVSTQLQSLGQRFTKLNGSTPNILSKDKLVNFLSSQIYINPHQIENGTTYGFTHEGKIYLNPEVVNSSTPIHEYTHLWDAYIQNTNAELWQKGKEAFKETTLWQEVISDPNYADIANNDDLVLSECHARITGKVAEKVLEKIALENGEIAKDKVIDWDKETWQYIAENYSVDITKFASVAEFIQTPMKDLMEGKNIQLFTPVLSKESIEKRINNPEIDKKLKEVEKEYHTKQTEYLKEYENNNHEPYEKNIWTNKDVDYLTLKDFESGVNNQIRDNRILGYKDDFYFDYAKDDIDYTNKVNEIQYLILNHKENLFENAKIYKEIENCINTKKSTTSLSGKHDYSLSNFEVATLAYMHKNGNKTTKNAIEDLLKDINFHSENSDFISGNYQRILNKYDLHVYTKSITNSQKKQQWEEYINIFENEISNKIYNEISKNNEGKNISMEQNQEQTKLRQGMFLINSPTIEEMQESEKLSHYIAGNEELGYHFDKELFNQEMQSILDNLHAELKFHGLTKDFEIDMDTGFTHDDGMNISIEAHQEDIEQIAAQVRFSLNDLGFENLYGTGFMYVDDTDISTKAHQEEQRKESGFIKEFNVENLPSKVFEQIESNNRSEIVDAISKAHKYFDYELTIINDKIYQRGITEDDDLVESKTDINSLLHFVAYERSDDLLESEIITDEQLALCRKVYFNSINFDKEKICDMALNEFDETSQVENEISVMLSKYEANGSKIELEENGKITFYENEQAKGKIVDDFSTLLSDYRKHQNEIEFAENLRKNFLEVLKQDYDEEARPILEVLNADLKVQKISENVYKVNKEFFKYADELWNKNEKVASKVLGQNNFVVENSDGTYTPVLMNGAEQARDIQVRFSETILDKAVKVAETQSVGKVENEKKENQENDMQKIENEEKFVLTTAEVNEYQNIKDNLEYLCSMSADDLTSIALDMKNHNDKNLGSRMNRKCQEIISSNQNKEEIKKQNQPKTSYEGY